MSEFTEKLNSSELVSNAWDEIDKDQANAGLLIDVIKSEFKDWRPPKELVEVPQLVANFIKTLKMRGIKPLMDSATFGEIGFTEEKRDEILHWINEHQEEYMRAWLDDYTVERPKENLYFVKLPGVPTLNSYMCKSCSPGELGYNEKYSSKNFNEVRFGLRYDKKYSGGWQRQFTESEIKDIDPRYLAFSVKVEED